MGHFADLLRGKGAGSCLDNLTPDTLVGLDEVLPPGVRPPEAYVAFISEVGWGSLTDETLTLYSGLVDPASVFGRNDEAFSGILLFADDMAGRSYGFRTSDWTLMEIDAAGKVEPCKHSEFGSFIRSQVRLCEQWASERSERG